MAAPYTRVRVTRQEITQAGTAMAVEVELSADESKERVVLQTNVAVPLPPDRGASVVLEALRRVNRFLGWQIAAMTGADQK